MHCAKRAIGFAEIQNGSADTLGSRYQPGYPTTMANLQELLAQKQKLDQQIALMQSEARNEAILKIQQIMRDYGLTLTDLAAPEKRQLRTSSGAKVEPKYRDPSTGATWTGRGLKPKWLTAALAGGRSIEEFAV